MVSVMRKVCLGAMLTGAGVLADPTARVIRMRADDIPVIRCSQGQVCAVQFPDGEAIADTAQGASTTWEVSPSNTAKHVLFIKTRVEGKDNPIPVTTMQVTMQSGNVYSFQLVDVSGKGSPDIRTSIELVDQKMRESIEHPKYVPASTVAEAIAAKDARIAELEKELAQQKTDSAAQVGEQVAKFQQDFLRGLRPDGYDRDLKGKRDPFHLTAILRTDKNTFFYFDNPSEVPALYEIRDGKPSLVDRHYDNGVLIASGALDDGYLSAGNSKLSFHWKGAK